MLKASVALHEKCQVSHVFRGNLVGSATVKAFSKSTSERTKHNWDQQLGDNCVQEQLLPVVDLFSICSDLFLILHNNGCFLVSVMFLRHKFLPSSGGQLVSVVSILTLNQFTLIDLISQQ